MMDFLRESWKFLTSPPIYPLYVGIAAGAVAILGAKITAYMEKQRLKRREEERSKDPEVLFLDSALDDDPVRKPNPNYSYAEFQRDLHDKGLTFEEIYEKCGGVFPKKPEQGLYGPQGYQGPMETPEHRPGLHGPSGAPGFQGFQGADGRCPDRMSELQVWFKERGKTSHVGGLVPPPPNPYPIVNKIYIRGRR
jgi:hypothetical protein